MSFQKKRYKITKYVGRILPIEIKVLLIKVQQSIIFWRAIRKFKDRIEKMKEIDDDLLLNLIYGWGNAGFSAHVSYLRAVIDRVLITDGPVLECGSGLSTLLMGIIADKRDIDILTLEHSLYWKKHIVEVLQRFSVIKVDIRHAQIKEYEDFEWYNIDGLKLPQGIKLIVCDGPPSDIKGGRYGLMSNVSQYLGNNCIILLDDYAREQEREIVARWKEKFGIKIWEKGYPDLYAEILI